MALALPVFAQDPVPFADFEEDENGWWTEEHATGLFWIDETAGPSSKGAITLTIDPSLPDDDSPEAKIAGSLPEGINIADYEYISFYYRCDSEAYTGSTMFVMPMAADWSTGGGASHSGTMIGDDQWHYEEYHVSEFVNWWGGWSWDQTVNLVIGIWETKERGPAFIWLDHVMLFNQSGEGMLLAEGGAPEVALTTPVKDDTVSNVSEITIVFNQEVQGVEAGDLLVNGEPATDVVTQNGRNYVFSGFPTPVFEDTTLKTGTVTVELQSGAIQSLAGDAFAGFSYSFNMYIFVALPATALADFETDTNGWWTEEHAIDLTWVNDDSPDLTKSKGAITTFIDPDQPDDDTPESKIQGQVPDTINMAGYQYISFYYKCDEPLYDGNTMFVMPMTDGWSAGAGASHSGSMLGDGQWHYEEYHRDEFENWWGQWSWEDTLYVVIGVWETNERGFCQMWYDHIMLFNNPGEGRLDYDPTAVPEWSLY
jgi:hypothetical protein